MYRKAGSIGLVGLIGLIFTLTTLAQLLASRPVIAHRQASLHSTIMVNTTLDELNNDGNCSLREAIQAANTDAVVDACLAGSGTDTIVLPAGIYTLTLPGANENNNATGDLDILSNLAIDGASANNTIVNGGQLDRVIDLSGTVVISGVNVTNGYDRGSTGGGGILVGQNSVLLLTNSTVSLNRAAAPGGGIANMGVLTLTNSAILSNTSQATLFGGGGLANGGAAVLNNSTVRGNTALMQAGGIINLAGSGYTATLTLNASSVIGNATTDGSLIGGGGGIMNMPFKNATALMTLNDSVIMSNTAAYSVTASGVISVTGLGGGLLNGSLFDSGLGIVTLNRSTVSGNTGLNGGGLANASLVLGPVLKTTLNNSTVSGNTAAATAANLQSSGNGGGLLNQRGQLVLVGSTVSHNQASATGSGTHNQTGNGGGIMNFNGSLTLVNSTVSGNTAQGSGPVGGLGGGLGIGGEMITTTVWLTNATVTGNTAQVSGDSVANVNLGYPTATYFSNSLITGSCDNSSGTLVSKGHNLEDDHTCSLTDPTDSQDANPLLGPLANNGGDTLTHALLAGSPAIDKADNAVCAAPPVSGHDQRGVSRPQGAACDIGAFEAAEAHHLYLPLVLKNH